VFELSLLLSLELSFEFDFDYPLLIPVWDPESTAALPDDYWMPKVVTE